MALDSTRPTGTGVAVQLQGRNEGWSFCSLKLSSQVHDEDVVITVAFFPP